MKRLLFTVAVGLMGSTSATAQKSHDELDYPLLRDIEIPEVDRSELSNGLVLYLLEDHTLPKVEGFALIRTGDRFEPADRVGLASMVGQVMRTGGSATRSGEEMDRLLENTGSSVETAIGETSGTASLFTLTENLPMSVGILADILRNPAFPQEKIDLAKVQMKGAIARRNDNVVGVASREFIKLLYGVESPYGRTTEYATIDRIVRNDLIAFHRKYFHPNQIILGLWGDFESSEVKALVDEHFGSWEAVDVDMPALPEVSARSEGSVHFIPRDDVNQTNLRIGHLGGRRDDPDYFALQLMAEVLGGGFSSRLFGRVRSELGLAYAVSASWNAAWDHPGTFFIFCNTKSESTVQAAEEIIRQVRLITEEPVSKEELNIAKDGIINSWVFNFDSQGEIVRRLMTYDYYGYPRDFLETFRRNIEKVTPADVLEAAKRHVRPEELVILAVGRAEDFDRPLSTLGEVETIDITIPPPSAPPAPPE